MKLFGQLLFVALMVTCFAFSSVEMKAQVNNYSEYDTGTLPGDKIDLKVYDDFYKADYAKYLNLYEAEYSAGSMSNFDVSFYHLSLELSLDSSFLAGNVLCSFNSKTYNLSEIKLNLYRTFTIDSIVGNVNDFVFEGDTIFIELDKSYLTDEKAELQIFYKGKPRKNNLVGYSFNNNTGDPRIVTVCCPKYSHYWWPCKEGPGDKADSVYLDITIPDSVISEIPVNVVSNGILNNVDLSNGSKTFKWRVLSPIATYYVMVAVANYEHISDVYEGQYGESFPLVYYVFPDSYNKASFFVDKMPEVMEFFSDIFGIYPFYREKYGMTQMMVSTGLENQTNLVWNAGSWQSSSFWVSVHELAHQWFGCMLSYADLHNIWLHEGFASYCEALWYEHTGGLNAYRNVMSRLKYLGAGTPYHIKIPSSLSDLYNYNVQYKRSAWVLHMLRNVVGDTVFFNCLKEYVNKPEFMYEHVTTENFIDECERISGQELNFFFDQWVFDEFHPVYRFDYEQNEQNYNTDIVIEQMQAELGRREVFEMPVELRINFSNGTDTMVRVWNDQKLQNYTLSFNMEIDTIDFDPYRWILREMYKPSTSLAQNNDKESSLSNSPNPFSSNTIIKYTLSENSAVTICLYYSNGQKIQTILKESSAAGEHSVNFNGRHLSSGVYFYSIESKDNFTCKKMILLK